MSTPNVIRFAVLGTKAAQTRLVGQLIADATRLGRTLTSEDFVLINPNNISDDHFFILYGEKGSVPVELLPQVNKFRIWNGAAWETFLGLSECTPPVSLPVPTPTESVILA
jgi:hypothetical protein